MMEQLDPLGTSVTTACSYSPADKGYGIRAAVWAGANLDKEAAPMLFDRGIIAPGQDAGYVESSSAFGGKAFPGTIKQYNPGTQPFLKVNRHGERFANESCPYNDIVYAAAHQPGRVYAQIHDDNWYEDVQRFHTIGCSAQTRNGGPDYVLPQMSRPKRQAASSRLTPWRNWPTSWASPAPTRRPSWPPSSGTTSCTTSRTTRTSASPLTA